MKRRTNAAGTGAPSGRNGSVLRWALFGAACFGLGFLCAVPLREQRPQPESAVSENATDATAAPGGPASATPSARRQRMAERPFLVRPVDSCPAADTEGERAYRVQQSRELIGLLAFKVRTATRLHLAGGPESIANDVSPWLSGWTEALVRTAPDLVDELAAEIETGLCDPQGDPAAQIVLSRVLGYMPELANGRGIDCIADRGKEDIVLWSALDAWRVGALPSSPALERLASSAADERTLSRLTKFEPKHPGPSPDQPPEGEPVEYLPNATPETDELMARVARDRAAGTVSPMLAKLLEQGAATTAPDNAQATEPESQPAAVEDVQ